MKSQWTLFACFLGKIDGFKLEIGLHHTRHDRRGNRTTLLAMVKERQDDNLGIIIRGVGKRPGVRGPRAELALLQLPRHIIAIFGSARFTSYGNGERILDIEDLI